MRKNIRKQSVSIFVFFIFLISMCYKPVFADERCIVPVGRTVGVTLRLKGISVVDTAIVKDYDGKKHEPAAKAGIKCGDVIKKINGTEINSVEKFEQIINDNGENKINIEFSRNGAMYSTEANAVLSAVDGFYRLGVWIKDAASGIGTMTYFDPQTMEFGGLGHGITDVSGDEVIEIFDGDALEAEVVSVQKGEKGVPGELIGVFSENKGKIGKIKQNTVAGIKGIIENPGELKDTDEAIPIASKDEIHEGEAEIKANVEGTKINKYSVEIQKINKNSNDSKCMVIKVTDKGLLEKTGGIVQGMSGCPILQNGKIVGAITHVLINDPSRGYGIFIEKMISE